MLCTLIGFFPLFSFPVGSTEVTRGSGTEEIDHAHDADRMQTLMQQSHTTSQTHTHTQTHAPSSSSSPSSSSQPSPINDSATTKTTTKTPQNRIADDPAPPPHGADRGTTGALSGSRMDARMEMLKMKANASTVPPAMVCPTDHESIELLDKAGVSKQGAGAGVGAADVAANADVKVLDKRSLDYVLRTGLAGGLAGCAVCSLQAGL